MVRGAADVLEEAGRQILVGTTDFTVHREEKVLLEILRRRPDGVVLVGGSHSPRTRNLLTVAGIPVVETWDLPEQPLGHVVGFSNSGVFSALVDYLVERNYKNIAFVGVDSPDDTRGVSRLEGFRSAMKRHGLDPRRVVQMGAPPASVEAGGEAIVVVRRNWPDVDAVLFISDRTAYGALMEAKRRGWNVPGDFAITGFGDFDMARNSHPRITSVEIDCAGIGRKAARIVLDHGPSAGNESQRILQPETVLMNFRILARETT
jgi:LacI family gluconate utilization system Gnt-I transcriptional repressor